MYGPKKRISKYMWQKLIELKGKIAKPTITVRGFNVPLSIVDRLSRQKIHRYR